MDNTSTQRIISLCTGYAGLELGLHLTGLNVRTVAYVEIEAFACANLVAKIEQGKLDAAPIWTDIKTFDGEPFRGKVHGIIGGYPCQPFSNAGQRKGTDDPRHLWPYIETHIRTIRPIWCFFENVSGHLTLGFEEVFRSLRDMGYAVEAGLFTAAEVGAPHKRERLFILAYSSIDGALRRSGAIQQTDGRSGGTLLRQPVGADTELENPERIGRRRRDHGEPGGQGRTLQTEGPGQLGDSEHDGHVTEQVIQGDEKTRWQGRMQKQTKTRQFTGANRPGDVQSAQRSTGGSKQLADTESKRTQRDGRERQQERGKSARDVPHSYRERLEEPVSRRPEKALTRAIINWPARPGQEQHDWEEPRTVKSGMGRAVDGFASRVDELRLLGNGVVPTCVELAFRTLWERANEYKKENLKM